MVEVIIKSVPFMVRLLSLWYFIHAIYYIFIGILGMTASGYLINDLIKEYAITEFLKQIQFIDIFIFGAISSLIIIFFIVGIIYFLLGRGLWRGKNWARILVIIFTGINIILGILLLVYGT